MWIKSLRTSHTAEWKWEDEIHHTHRHTCLRMEKKRKIHILIFIIYNLGKCHGEQWTDCIWMLSPEKERYEMEMQTQHDSEWKTSQGKKGKH